MAKRVEFSDIDSLPPRERDEQIFKLFSGLVYSLQQKFIKDRPEDTEDILSYVLLKYSRTKKNPKYKDQPPSVAVKAVSNFMNSVFADYFREFGEIKRGGTRRYSPSFSDININNNGAFDNEATIEDLLEEHMSYEPENPYKKIMIENAIKNVKLSRYNLGTEEYYKEIINKMLWEECPWSETGDFRTTEGYISQKKASLFESIREMLKQDIGLLKEFGIDLRT